MAAINNVSQSVIASQTPQQIAGLPERTNQALHKIIRDNFNTQYATQADSLTKFRDAVSRHGGTEMDAATLLADFRAHVPLSEYVSYGPFVDKFNVQPCKEEDVKDLFAPGLPDFLALSGATSGAKPKVLPRYNHNATVKIGTFDPNNKDPFAGMITAECVDVKMIERSPGEVVQRIPLCCGSGGVLRKSVGAYIDDEMSGYAVPWAATVIRHTPSFLIIHGLFFLSHRNVYRFHSQLATRFIDLIRHIDEHWDLLVSCIRDGVLPELEGIDDVRGYLQAHFHPKPERAAELREIGPPFSSEVWFSRVWPKANCLSTMCAGSVATVLPKVRSILGPNVIIRNFAYTSSEASMGIQHDANKLDEFMLWSNDIIEFLDVSLDATHENLCQAWEVEVGKHYEPIVTTRDGLWRYRVGDILHIVGFATESQSPLFKLVGRRPFTIRFPGQLTQITDDQLLAAIQRCDSEDGVRVQEFTTVLDDRTSLPTVSFFIELAEPLGPNAHLTSQKLFDILATYNSELRIAFSLGKIRPPTIRIVKAGTFANYRQWKGEIANIPSGQIKIPSVLLELRAQEWISNEVVQEL